MPTTGSFEIPWLSGLSPAEQQHLLDCMTTIELPRAAVLFHEGDPGDSLYIVTAGEVEILKAMGTAEEHWLALSGPGTFIGEVALLDSQGRRTASARVRSPATLLRMTAADFHALMDNHPVLASRMTQIISNRLREASESAIRDLEAKNRVLAQAYRDLQAAQAQIIEKEKLEKELDIAREIQLSMLPEVLPQAAGYSFGARMQAARWLGGDFYDLFPLDEQRIAVAVGDVSDKGVPAALFMALTRSLLRAEAQRLDTPVQMLRRINTLLQETSNAGQFVTVVFGVLDVRTGRFEYARAGHEQPIWLRADGRQAAIPASTGMILGMLPEVAIDVAVIQLHPGDVLLLFSDGAPDAMNGAEQRFGHARLVEELRAGRGRPAQAVCDHLLAVICDFQDTAAQFDDICLVAVGVD